MNEDRRVSVGVNLSVNAETARLLIQMATDMEITLDDILSSLAEDAVIDLKRIHGELDFTYIPDQCSKQDLLNAIE